ncbi:conserved hypothetical protein [Burkholderia diffusa]|uniref:ESPR-type extended signal peptide-containing protein n=1 Tax=Burkholderia diffusa TaxID=488732 RepID=UPI001CB1DDB4|nr:ESPR-type extended signal peptide-containing protein [Burkholderia diffusa]CAG9264180.1 conserved hypothetical protein [Burkholderia diffusa]
MNKTYRNIWNAATGTWTAVAETAKSRSKGSARAARGAVVALALGGASIGGAFAADTCTTEDGTPGSVDAAGICTPANMTRTMSTRSIGTNALDETIIKINPGLAGTAATATNSGSIAIGGGAMATASGSDSATGGGIAIGQTASAAHSSVAVGAKAFADAIAGQATSAAFGTGSYANGAGVTALGANATATSSWTVAVGGMSSAGANQATAIGYGATVSAQGTNSVALGRGSVADAANVVSVGTTAADGQRRIVNMAAGTQLTDAVNVQQLKPVVTALGGGADIDSKDGTVTGPTYVLTNGGTQTTVGGALGALDGELTTAKGNIAQNTADITNINNQLGDLASGTIGLVQQNATTRNISVAKDTDGDIVDFTNASGSARTLTGVGAGEVSATSLDAINGSQLHGVSQSVADAIGAGSRVDTDGSITAPTFTVGDGNGGTTVVHNVGDVVTNLDGRVTTNEGNIAHLADQIGSGTVGLVQQDATTRNITVAKDTDGDIVDFTNAGGSARTLTGVGAGEVSATSLDAINGSQLHGVSQSVVDAIGAGSRVDTDGSITAPTFTVGDGNGGTTVVHNVGDVVTNLDGRVTTNEGNIANLADQIGSGTVGLVQQDATTRNITVAKDTDGDIVDFTNASGSARTLTGVGAGEVSATSLDAINGSQLHGVSQSVVDAIGAGSRVDTDGSITAPTFTVGDGNGGTTVVHNVGDAVTNLDDRVTTNEGNIAHLGDQLAAGQLGLVRQDAATSAITVGAATGGSSVNIAGTNGTRTLSGVANGVNDDDAVTIAQLRATGLIDYTGKEIGAVTYDDLSLDSVTFRVGGTALHNVAPGLIASGSMDAVNGGQLYDLQQQFAQRYDQLSGQMDDLTDRVGGLETGGGSGGGSGGGMGPGTGTGGDGSLVVGDGANASGENSTAVGQGAVASGDNGSAFGQGSAATGDNGTAIGQGSAASGDNGTAVGQGSAASGENSTAIGQGSSASGSGSVAIGAGSIADEANTVSFGNGTDDGNRRLVNVADGINASDAATKGQLDRAMESVDQRFGETNRMINDVAKNAYAGVAAAMAMPNLTPSQPGKTVVAVGAANYKSGSAVAAGATYRTRDGKWLMNGALSVTSTGDAGVRAQVGYEF